MLEFKADIILACQHEHTHKRIKFDKLDEDANIKQIMDLYAKEEQNQGTMKVFQPYKGSGAIL